MKSLSSEESEGLIILFHKEKMKLRGSREKALAEPEENQKRHCQDKEDGPNATSPFHGSFSRSGDQILFLAWLTLR